MIPAFDRPMRAGTGVRLVRQVLLIALLVTLFVPAPRPVLGQEPTTPAGGSETRDSTGSQSPVAPTPAPASDAAPAQEEPAPTAVPQMNPAGAAASAATVGNVDEAELAATIALLEDSTARTKLLAQLKALQASLKQAGVLEQSPAENVMDKVTDTVNHRVQAVVDTAKAVVSAIGTLPNLADWLAFQVTNEYRRAFWYSVLQGVGLILGGGLLLVILLMRLVRMITGKVRLRPEHGHLRRTLRRGWVCCLDILPAIGFFLAGSIVLRVLPLADVTIAVGTYGVLCFAIGHVVWVLTYHAFAVKDAEWRWFKMSDEVALDMHRFFRRTILVALDGYFVLLAADRLGLPGSLHTVLSHILFIIICATTTMWLVRRRQWIEGVLRQLGGSGHTFLRDALPWDLIASRGFLVAIALAWLYYFVWAIGVPGGFRYLFVASLVTAATVVAFQAAILLLSRLQHRLGQTTPEEQAENFDPMPRRAGDAVIFAFLGIVARIAAVLVLAQVWGLDVIGWLRSPGGKFVLERGLRIGIVVVVAAVVWLVLDRAIRRYLTAQDAEGNIKHSNRSRTLANIGRNVVLVLIGLFAGATVLAELGVDTGPLLAGAGVVGLAIGFGSQALVKDIITGLFILLGDTMRVGDVVDLGGQSGAVETMSMRAVVLRAYNGSVMTIPYGSITTITNLTKDFSYAVFNVALTYRADVDTVCDMLRELDEQIRREWPYRRVVLAPIEIAGVDKFLDSSIVLLARMKTRPGDQWRVQREFNKRIKQELNARGIEIPYPHQTVYFGADWKKSPDSGAAEAAMAAAANQGDGSPMKSN